MKAGVLHCRDHCTDFSEEVTGTFFYKCSTTHIFLGALVWTHSGTPGMSEDYNHMPFKEATCAHYATDTLSSKHPSIHPTTLPIVFVKQSTTVVTQPCQNFETHAMATYGVKNWA